MFANVSFKYPSECARELENTDTFSASGVICPLINPNRKSKFTWRSYEMPTLEECLCWGQEESLCAHRHQHPGPETKLEDREGNSF